MGRRMLDVEVLAEEGVTGFDRYRNHSAWRTGAAASARRNPR